jgi:hypothetical protein
MEIDLYVWKRSNMTKITLGNRLAVFDAPLAAKVAWLKSGELLEVGFVSDIIYVSSAKNNFKC